MTKGSDVYSFGVLLWSLWAGQHPFVGQDGMHMPNKLFPTFTRARTSDESGTHVAYRALAEACLRKDPHDRPTFDEIASRLLKIFGPPSTQPAATAATAATAPSAATAAATASGSGVLQPSLLPPPPRHLGSPV